MRAFYLHGFASGPSSGKALWLRERFREAGIDLKIPSLVTGEFKDMTISSQLEIVTELAGTDEPVTLVGSSMGGYVAALFANRHPERVNRLALLAPAFGFPTRWMNRWPSEDIAAWRRDGEFPVWHHHLDREERVGYQLVTDGNQYPDFPSVTVPTLIFHGARDETVPLKYSEDYTTANPLARLRVLDSDHSLADVLEPIWEEMSEFFGLQAIGGRPF